MYFRLLAKQKLLLKKMFTKTNFLIQCFVREMKAKERQNKTEK